MNAGGLYESVLRQLARGAELPAPRPPRASAAVVLWRSRGAALEVFWIQRSLTLPFMGGFHAFPGGGVTRSDRGVGIGGMPQGIAAAPAAAAMPVAVTDGVELGPILSPGLLAGALRELFEETGILLAPALGDTSVQTALRDRLVAGRRAVEAREVTFGEFVDDLGLALDASDLTYAGRWLTPPLGPLRFDNRFFLLEWPEDRPQQPLVVPGEAATGEWIEPGRALDLWEEGRVTTAPPILHILRVLQEEGPATGSSRLLEPSETNLGPHRWIEFRPGVMLFPLRTPTLPPASFTNCYLLGRREAVLVDPGSPHPEEIERLATALEIVRDNGLRRTEAIWLTHHHPDHVGGVEALRRRLRLPVAAHAETAARLAESGIAVDRELADGDRHLTGGSVPFPVRVLHTPGHARGHLCFLDESLGSLLVGDLVAGFGTIVVDPPEGDMAQYLLSLERVRALAPKALFPAHGPVTIDAVGKLEEYITHRRWREERILTAWRDGIREPAALREVVYEEIPAVAQPLAERQIVAHLEHLERTGRLEDSL